jgi:hypothetical protein
MNFKNEIGFGKTWSNAAGEIQKPTHVLTAYQDEIGGSGGSSSPVISTPSLSIGSVNPNPTTEPKTPKNELLIPENEESVVKLIKKPILTSVKEEINNVVTTIIPGSLIGNGGGVSGIGGGGISGGGIGSSEEKESVLDKAKKNWWIIALLIAGGGYYLYKNKK